MSSFQAEIEAPPRRSASREVEVLLAEVVGGHRCGSSSTIPTASRSSSASASRTRSPSVRERYALEVSSPGIERPLTKPDHFRRFLGRRARVRTRDAARRARAASPASSSARATARSRSPPTRGVVAIPYADIHRSNLVEE